MNERTAKAIERIVAEAPPLPDRVADLLRQHRCPIVGRGQKAAA